MDWQLPIEMECSENIFVEEKERARICISKWNLLITNFT